MQALTRLSAAAVQTLRSPLPVRQLWTSILPSLSRIARTCSTMAAQLKPLQDVSQLSERVTRVLGCNPSLFTLQGTNCYLLGSGKSKILVDTGEKDNAQFLSNLGRTLTEHGWSIQEVLITHWHHDHTGGIPGVCQIIKENPVKISKIRRGTGESEPLGDLEYTYVEDGQVFTAEGVTLRAVFTPGHSDDHMSLWMAEEDALFSGDTVLGEGSAVFEDLYDYMKSLDKMRSLEPSIVYPAHGSVIDDPSTHITDYINHRNKREQQILAVLQGTEEALGLDDIIHRVYGELSAPLHRGAQNNVGHHLKKMIKEEKIVAVEEGRRYQANKSNL